MQESGKKMLEKMANNPTSQGRDSRASKFQNCNYPLGGQQPETSNVRSRRLNYEIVAFSVLFRKDINIWTECFRSTNGEIAQVKHVYSEIKISGKKYKFLKSADSG